MKMILNQTEIGTAIVEYLAKRGVQTDLSKIFMERLVAGNRYAYEAEIREVELPPKDGPYR